MSFSDIYGHEWQKDFFRKVLRNQRVANAYLFAGPPRIGKRTFALELAKALHCLRPKDGESCGECRSCALCRARSHPDLVILSSEESIKIDQVRDFLKNFHLQKTLSDFKVGIGIGIEKLTEEAGNCLLKTIEEPPLGGILIFTTSRWYSVLPTIVSRCQLVEFSPLSEREVKRYLVEKRHIREEEAEKVASLAMGSIGRAVELVEGKKNPLQEVVRFWRLFQDGKSIVSLGQWFRKMESEEMVLFFSLLESYLRDLLYKILVFPESEAILSQEEWVREVLVETKNFGAPFLIKVIRLLEGLIEDLSWHVQPDIAIIDVFGKIRGEMENAMGSRSTVWG
ncbi:MAG: DNA polymerase III subunit [Candidatus Caldatribacteriaceae bacterium]